ncbi:hypothetical protein A2875_04075 [Candidatus Gottesmanbacteria bacterium RIFCSPHIGHO2_01_FULL_46_14]|uniref:Plasmid stabilization protein n=2 Tax=Candidatus Gottesmaniibacteriota TaxID=1752720 RepID=A0A1F5ZMR2_9BACT|nr:MAG: hypothetical protein A2875_04075 [Candidatus Gottesmanbacteria bacterium RIFCSPHIGHO2_01_FULL_46_14]OGG29888.1 MAG: hypothetical protein A2971_05125 [Candidatus Gottesmanbacteria bacterium RIFCSPLOWO2_01_FULL_46_21]
MKIVFSQEAERVFLKLAAPIQKKVKKQFLLLDQDFFYPSLYTKKMSGIPNEWEIRIDRHYRASFRKEGDEITIDSLGPHDTGLGKK